jgi:protein-L-isoaspartate(D-aspartate) O-methyltransferase
MRWTSSSAAAFEPETKMGHDSQGLRIYYANLVVGRRTGTQDTRIIAAFEAIPRERFVGPGPWKVFAAAGKYIETPSDDLCFLYQDVLVALSEDRRINNGEPSLHARCLTALCPAAGETALHIGTGAGYYTALLAHLVGPAGSVVGYDIEQDLMARAAANLLDWPNVTVRCASGSDGELGSYDVIYVNAGATHPLAIWLDAIRPGGRLLFPLTPDEGLGGMLLVTRRARGFAARFVSPATFIPCAGARDPEMAKALAHAFGHGDMLGVRSLRRNTTPDESCWVAGDDWWLSTEDHDDA